MAWTVQCAFLIYMGAVAVAASAPNPIADLKVKGGLWPILLQ